MLGARVWVPLLIRRAFCERAALEFWRARVRGAVLGSGVAVGGRFASRQGLAGAGFLGALLASDMRLLRAHRIRARAATTSGRSGAVPWVPSCRRWWLLACGARWLQRGDGRRTPWTQPSTSGSRPMGCTPSELRSFRMRTSFRNVPYVKMILAAGPHGPAFIPGGHVKPSSIHTPKTYACS